MITVKIQVNVKSWYAHGPRGYRRQHYFGGSYHLTSKHHSKYKYKYVDPHTKEYLFEDVFIMNMVNEAISLLKKPCQIELFIPTYSFPYEPLKKGIYKYWKRNNWCYKNGRRASNYWIEFDKLICEKGHVVKVIECSFD